MFSLVPSLLFCDLDSVKKQIELDLKIAIMELNQLDDNAPEGMFLVGKAQGFFHCLFLIEQDLLK